MGSLLVVVVPAQTEGSGARNESRHAGCCCTSVQALANTVATWSSVLGEESVADHAESD